MLFQQTFLQFFDIKQNEQVLLSHVRQVSFTGGLAQQGEGSEQEAFPGLPGESDCTAETYSLSSPSGQRSQNMFDLEYLWVFFVCVFWLLINFKEFREESLAEKGDEHYKRPQVIFHRAFSNPLKSLPHFFVCVWFNVQNQNRKPNIFLEQPVGITGGETERKGG